MPSMFPGMYPSMDDPNRRPRSGAKPSDGSFPSSLRIAYYLCVGAAILMVLSGLVMLTGDVGDRPEADPELLAAFLRNVRFVGIFNIIAGLVIAALAAQLKVGGKISRRVLVGVIALTVFCNVVAFAIQVGAWAMILIVVLLAIAAFMMFRTDSNDYIVRRTG